MSATRDDRCSACGETRPLLSIRAAAELVGVNRKTIYRWIDAGLLEYRRLPSRSIRIYEESLLRVPGRGNGRSSRKDRPARSAESDTSRSGEGAANGNRLRTS